MRLYDRYELQNVHPYKFLDTETGTILKPEGVTTIIGKTLSKGDRFSLWPMYEATTHLKEYFNDDEGIHYTGRAFHKQILIAETKHSDKSTRGMDVGSEVHALIETYLGLHRDGLVMEDVKYSNPAANKAFNAFIDWFSKQNAKVLATEQVVYSPTHAYAGTFDALLEIDGKIVLCDVKTSNRSLTAPLGIYDSYFLQLGGYSVAYKEEKLKVGYTPEEYAKDDTISDLMVINASKEGKLSTLRASELGLNVSFCEDAFLSLLNVHKFIKPLQRQIKERVA